MVSLTFPAFNPTWRVCVSATFKNDALGYERLGAAALDRHRVTAGLKMCNVKTPCTGGGRGWRIDAGVVAVSYDGRADDNSPARIGYRACERSRQLLRQTCRRQEKDDRANCQKRK